MAAHDDRWRGLEWNDKMHACNRDYAKCTSLIPPHILLRMLFHIYYRCHRLIATYIWCEISRQIWPHGTDSKGTLLFTAVLHSYITCHQFSQLWISEMGLWSRQIRGSDDSGRSMPVHKSLDMWQGRKSLSVLFQTRLSSMRPKVPSNRHLTIGVFLCLRMWCILQITHIVILCTWHIF